MKSFPQYLIQNFKNSNGHIISIGCTSFVKCMTFMALVFKLHLSWNNNIEKNVEATETVISFVTKDN